MRESERFRLDGWYIHTRSQPPYNTMSPELLLQTRTLIKAALEYVPRALGELFVSSTANEQMRILRYTLGESEQLVPLFLPVLDSVLAVLLLRCLGGRGRVGGRLFSFRRQSLAFAWTRSGGFEPGHGSLAASWNLAAVSFKQGSESRAFERDDDAELSTLKSK